MSAWVITDGEGKMPVAEMRDLFEKSVQDTEKFRVAMSLTTVEVAGKFSHYEQEETDRFWIGFAIGLRCAERLGWHRERRPS